jgi:hypothetical protein
LEVLFRLHSSSFGGGGFGIVISSLDPSDFELASPLGDIGGIKVACAYPTSPTRRNTRGINGTEWVQIDRTMYDSCIDSRDYRPKPAGTP